MATSSYLARFKVGTAAEFAAEAPVLEVGEIALESDTGVVSIGDGSTAYGASLLRSTFT
jgi:hypothetical protein